MSKHRSHFMSCDDPHPVEVRCDECGDVYVIECFSQDEWDDIDLQDLDCMSCGSSALQEV